LQYYGLLLLGLLHVQMKIMGGFPYVSTEHQYPQDLCVHVLWENRLITHHQVAPTVNRTLSRPTSCSPLVDVYMKHISTSNRSVPSRRLPGKHSATSQFTKLLDGGCAFEFAACPLPKTRQPNSLHVAVRTYMHTYRACSVLPVITYFEQAEIAYGTFTVIWTGGVAKCSGCRDRVDYRNLAKLCM
jgi:hypothetical protein